MGQQRELGSLEGLERSRVREKGRGGLVGLDKYRRKKKDFRRKKDFSFFISRI
jgi:hypothetical protein